MSLGAQHPMMSLDAQHPMPQPAAMTVAATSTPDNLLALAIEKGADVAALEKLMDLRERWMREEARRAYFEAKARFQSVCPELRRDREVSFGGRGAAYRYATLSGIAEQIRQPMADCGLTYRWEIDDTAEVIKVSCIVSHTLGHSEANTMSASPDDSGSKNAIQQRGSTVTYLQRYTLIGALGLSSANDDDDGRSGGAQNVETLRQHNEALRNWFESVHVIKTCLSTQQWERAAEAYAEIPEADLRALWVAPTKGGIFTTDERTALKSPDFAAALTRFRSAD